MSFRQPTIRVSGLLINDGRIMMIEQGRGEERYWLLPGGGVEFAEPLADALRREFLEELGLRVYVHRLLAIVESISPEPAYAKHVLHLVFEVTASPELLADAEPHDDKVLTVAWLDETDVQCADLRPPIGAFLCSCIRELPASTQYLGQRW